MGPQRGNNAAGGSIKSARAIVGMLLRTTLMLAMMTTTAQSLRVPATLGTHDPSRIIEDNGAFYFYGTSNGIAGWYTTDNGTTWKNTPSVFPNGIPTAVHAAAPKNDGHNIWAPDVIFNPNTNLFNIYYAVAAWGEGAYNVIGLVTSPTLNPSKAQWKDMGIVIKRDLTHTEYSAIDPCPFFDSQGNMYLSLGSGYGETRSTAINIISLDKMTGLRVGTNISMVQACGCEASAVQPHNGSYFLFWNTGGCCSGAKSTYTIHVARSSSPTGPFTDNQIFLASTSTMHGPGQIGFVNIGGQDYYTYHYYPNNGQAVMGFAAVDWSASGWPLAH